MPSHSSDFDFFKMDVPLRYSVLIWAGWLLTSLVLRAGPEALRDRAQAALQRTTTISLQAIQKPFTDSPAVSKGDSAQLATLQAENRAQASLIAQLQLENRQLLQAAPAIRIDPELPLVHYDAVPARIIGKRGDALSESLQLLISLGKRDSLLSGELILTGEGIVIDQGEQSQLKADQLLTAGRALFGRTTRVEKQTSLVQPITDPKFRMAARIVRRTNWGTVMGPQGILQGNGTGCELHEVAATEAVAVGDHVYTDLLVSPGAEPIYCGKVVRTDAAPGDHHWTIEVAPLHPASQLPEKLFVLRAALNPERIGMMESADSDR